MPRCRVRPAHQRLELHQSSSGHDDAGTRQPSPGGLCAGGFVSRPAFRSPRHGLSIAWPGDRPLPIARRHSWGSGPSQLHSRGGWTGVSACPDPHAFWPPSLPRSFSPGIGLHQPCERRSCAGASKSADHEAGGWASGSTPARDPCPLRLSGPLLPWALPLSGFRTPRWRADNDRALDHQASASCCIVRPSVPGHRFRRLSAHGFAPARPARSTPQPVRRSRTRAGL